MGPIFRDVIRALVAVSALLPFSAAVPMGLQIYSCTMPGVIAPGFDDGPWIYSEDILDRMQAAGFKATWFINGANKGNIYDYNSTLKRMINMGHQIGSHTWSHKDLATLTADGVRTEMLLLEEAMVNILGYFPYYMRPPFLSVNANSLQVLKDLDYHVIIGDLNTKDWEYQTESGIEVAKKLFTDGLDMGYTIVESHDQEVWTHGVLIDYMIEVVRNRGLKTVTVAECLQDSQLYRSVREPKPTNVTSSADAGPTVVYSLNGRCGNINAGNNLGWTCPPNGGRCCSKYGNCGSGADYCAASVCQPAFGLCDPAPSSSSYRDEAANSNTATTIPSRTVSATGIASATTTSSKAAASSLGPGSITPDGTCGNQGSGKNLGYICKTGQCCSKYGNCGTTTDYCSATVCQSAFGKCDAPAGRGSVSPDGTCGDIGKGNNAGYICKTGQCCSKYGNCGTTNDYCAASLGCQSTFGVCTGAASSIVSSSKSPVAASGSSSVVLNAVAPSQGSATPASSSIPSSSSTPSSNLVVPLISSSATPTSISSPANTPFIAVPSSQASLASSSGPAADARLAISASSSVVISSSSSVAGIVSPSSSVAAIASPTSSVAVVQPPSSSSAIGLQSQISSATPSSSSAASPSGPVADAAILSSSMESSSSSASPSSVTPSSSEILPGSSSVALTSVSGPVAAAAAIATAPDASSNTSAPSSNTGPSSSSELISSPEPISTPAPSSSPEPSSTPVSSNSPDATSVLVSSSNSTLSISSDLSSSISSSSSVI